MRVALLAHMRQGGHLAWRVLLGHHLKDGWPALACDEQPLTLAVPGYAYSMVKTSA